LNEDMGQLDPGGRESVDQLMTMIGDMRSGVDNIRTTCSTYFLLIDMDWFPRLCLSAHLNCVELREALLCLENGENHEPEGLLDDRQMSFCSLEMADQPGAALCPALEAQSELRWMRVVQAFNRVVVKEQPNLRPQLMRMLTLEDGWSRTRQWRGKP